MIPQVMKRLSVKTENNTKMNCSKAGSVIIDLLLQAKPGELPVAVTEHLANCDSCRNLFHNSIEGFNLLIAGRRSQPDPDFYKKVLAGIQVHDKKATSGNGNINRIIRLSPALVSAAAAVLLGIWIGGRLLGNLQPAIVDETAFITSDRSELLQAYANDLHLNDETTIPIERFLIDNETTESHDSK